MLTESALRELLNFTSTDPVLSVYLNTDPVEGNADAYRLRLRSMLKGMNMPQDVVAVERFFEREYDWSGRSVAIFSCKPANFFRAYSLAVPLPSRVYALENPYVKPLADLLDAFGGFGVVLVDKQGARVFSFHLGELREQEGVVGKTVKHTKRGGASSLPGRQGGVAGRTNYEDEVVERNMKEAVEFSVHFFENNHVRRILIGGTDDNVSQFRSLLPKSWQSLVVGTFSMSMNASYSEVLDKAMHLGVEAEKDRQAHLIDTVITAAAKGSGGVIGLDDTLNAVHEGRVQTLLLLEGFRAPGYHCDRCGFLTTQSRESCIFCGGKFHQIPDATEMAVRSAMKVKADVEVIHDNLALKNAGNIAALLRY